MSSGARIGLVAATVVVLVLAFVLLSPGDDDEPRTASTPTTSAPPPTRSTPATTTRPSASPRPPAADHEPTFEPIRVRGGQSAGGVKKITVSKGDRVLIQVASVDTSDEVHVHGYDIKRDLKRGGTVRFDFEADAEGIFEIELEGASTQIGQLTVEP